MAAKPEEQEPQKNRQVDDPLYREQGQSAARQHEREEQYETNRFRAGHVRCGGGWMVRRKKLGGNE